jgi:hypothetical protein
MKASAFDRAACGNNNSMDGTPVPNALSRRRSHASVLTRTLLVSVAAALLAASPGSVAAASGPIMLAWDPSPDASGYRVYIGTRPGSYGDIRDAGDVTVFLFEDAMPGVRYYFAVSAYARGGLESDLSNEVSGLAGSPVMQATAQAAQAPQASLAARLCDAARVECGNVEHLGSSRGRVTSLAAVPDGRLLLIEDGKAVRMRVGRQELAQPALVAAPGVELTGLRVDARFAETGAVFLEEITTRPDGARELSIVRYRLAGARLGEAAAIVSGIHLPVHGAAPFTTDADGRVYIAVPSSGRAVLALYEGTVIRFTADGRADGAGRAGSPVVAYGFAQPTGLQVDSAARVWISGAESSSRFSLGMVEANGSAQAAWPASPVPVMEASGGESLRLGALAESGTGATSLAIWMVVNGDRLARLGASSSRRFEALTSGGSGAILAAATDSDGSVLLAVEEGAATALIKITLAS